MTRRSPVTPLHDSPVKKTPLPFKSHDGHHPGYVTPKGLPDALRPPKKLKDGMTLDEFAHAHAKAVTRPILAHIQTFTRQLEAQIAFLEQLGS